MTQSTMQHNLAAILGLPLGGRQIANTAVGVRFILANVPIQDVRDLFCAHL